jgi:hypothetical protein
MDGHRRANVDEIQFQCRPGSPELNCCSVNAARGLGLLGEWALMRDDSGLLLNWYGPGTVRTSLPDGTPLALVLETAYPRAPEVRIRVEPDRAARFALGLRIPHWSARTTVALNGQEVGDVVPGRYLRLDRAWAPGDRLELAFDFRPQLWVGEHECAGRAALYRGPILLALDARFQPEGGDATDPLLDAAAIAWQPVACDDARPPMVLIETRDVDGRAIRLCDFAGAGVDGTAYRSWLRVRGVEPAAFDRAQPRRSRVATEPSP